MSALSLRCSEQTWDQTGGMKATLSKKGLVQNVSGSLDAPFRALLASIPSDINITPFFISWFVTRPSDHHHQLIQHYSRKCYVMLNCFA